MGFKNEVNNIMALHNTNGDLDNAINILIELEFN